MFFSSSDISNLDKIDRLKLINSITGLKPANLIGTKSLNGNTNLAIFSSIVHIGSNPPLIGFVTRTSKKVSRHTLENIIKTKKYTINQIQKNFVKKAHYTSAKFDDNISEFQMCKIEEEFIDDFYQNIWTIMSDQLLQYNPSLDETERLNRSAQIISLVEGSGFFIGSQRLRGKLPSSYIDHIVNSVIKLMLE